MQRFGIALLVGLIALSGLGMISPGVAEADGYTAEEIRNIAETARLEYQPMVLAAEDRRPYLPLLVRPGWELPTIDELQRSGIRFQTNLEAHRATWPESVRLVTLEEALNEGQTSSDEAQIASENDLDAESHSPATADVQ